LRNPGEPLFLVCGYLSGVWRLVAGGLRSVVAATAQPAGTWRGAACSSFVGLSSMGGSACFRPVGRRRCKQRPSNGWNRPLQRWLLRHGA